MAEQLALIDAETWRQELWFGMPDFVQESAEPAHSIVFHFETMQDVERLEALLGYSLPRGRAVKPSTWYPGKRAAKYADKRWVDGGEP